MKKKAIYSRITDSQILCLRIDSTAKLRKQWASVHMDKHICANTHVHTLINISNISAISAKLDKHQNCNIIQREIRIRINFIYQTKQSDLLEIYCVGNRCIVPLYSICGIYIQYVYMCYACLCIYFSTLHMDSVCLVFFFLFFFSLDSLEFARSQLLF